MPLEEVVLGRYFKVYPAKEADIWPIAKNLRTGDRLELERAYDTPPDVILLESLAMSERAWTAFAPDDEPVAMWGVARCPDHPEMGAVWLLGTNRVNEKLSDFLWLSRRFNREMGRGYRFLCNLVDAEYTEARKWLQWLGYQEGNIVKSALGYDFIEVFRVCALV